MKPRILQFLRGNGIPENSIEILMDRNSTIYKSWKARGIPTTFLIGKTGKVEGVWIGAIENVDSEDVTKKIQSLLHQLANSFSLLIPLRYDYAIPFY